MGHTNDYSPFGDERQHRGCDKALDRAEDACQKAIEERTEARAELFRAQERVRKLEDLLAPFAGLNRPSESEYEEIYDAVFLEATRIATKRREGK